MTVGSPLLWLGGKINIVLQAALDPGPEVGLWGVGEWDDALWAGAVPGWDTITSFAGVINITRGRERWGTRFQPGRLTATLTNEDGRFTLGSGVNPYGLTFQPGRHIRVAVVPDPDFPESLVPLFTGRVDSIPNDYSDGGYEIVCTVVAFDALAELANINPPATTPTGVERSDERVASALDYAGWPAAGRLLQIGRVEVQSSDLAQTTLEECARAADAEGGELFVDELGRVRFRERDWLIGGGEEFESMDFYETAVLALDPVAYWRMSGAPANTDTSGNGHGLTWNGSPDTQEPGVTTDDESVDLDATNDYATVTNPDPVTVDLQGEPRTIEAWVRVPAAGAGVVVENRITSPASSDWGFAIDPGVTVQALSPDTLLAFCPPAGEWVHLVMTQQPLLTTYDTRLYVNGLLADQNLTNTIRTGASVLNIGRSPAGGGVLYYSDRISEIVVYDQVLSADQVAANYSAYTAGGSNDRSIVVQGYIGYDTEQEAGVPYAPLEKPVITHELARIENDVRMARVGGSEQRVQDAASQAQFGHRTHTRLDLINNADEDVLFLAQRRVAANGELRRRVDKVTIAANADPDNDDLNRLFWATQFGDLLQVRVSTQYGWEEEFQAHVVGITHHITADDWTVTFALDDSLVEVLEALEP